MNTLGERAEQLLRVVREAREIAYDTETSGLDWKIHHPIGYVVTSSDFNAYIPIRHGGGSNLLDHQCGPLRTATDSIVHTHQFERELTKAFQVRRERGFLTIGHNLKFDMHMSAKHGIMLGRDCEDTSINAAMLDEFAKSFSLENCAIAAGVTPKKGTELYKHMAALFGAKDEKGIMGRFWELPGNDQLAVEYAMGDGTTTLELRAAQIVKIREEGMGVIHNVESQLIWTIFRMERRGIKVDMTRIAEVEKEVERQLILVRSKLPKNFNSRSPVAVKLYLEGHGKTDWPMTEPSSKFPNGQPSFNEKWLKTFPEGKAIVSERKLSNLDNSFLTPLKTEHTFNGRVYSSLNQMKGDEYGTISGRFSSSQPNLQQIPKRDKELGRLFRSVFVPDEGMDFYEADYSQCEPRLFAHYSREPALMDGYSRNPPMDMHHIVSQNFGVERDPTAKRMNMGILTGMYPPTFAAHMSWSLERATDEWNKWFALFPGIKDFQESATGLFKSSGYIYTILKRRCRMDHPRFAYRATSRIIQGSNADIVKYKLLQVDKWLESINDIIHLLMTVHDSYNWQAPKGSQGEKLSKEMVDMFCDVQTAPFSLRVPFIMDVGSGPSWAIATYGELAGGKS